MANEILNNLRDRQIDVGDDRPRVTPMNLVATILQYHAEGKSIGQICVLVNKSHARVAEIIQREYRKVVLPVREEARKKALLRLQKLVTAAYGAVESNQGELQLKAIDRALRVEERIARMLGTDAPTKIDATIHEQDTTDAELAEIIAAERARTRPC